MAVTPEQAAEVLARCARHCCICRRYRPLHLQVHHIVKRSDGGSDALTNLIAICVSCHSDVHSSSELTRRFTERELRLHSQNVCRLVGEGKLPAREEASALAELSSQLIRQLRGQAPPDHTSQLGLSIDAIDLLLGAISSDGKLSIERTEHGLDVRAGAYFHWFRRNISPSALYPDYVSELLTTELISGSNGAFFVTEAGYAFADDILSGNPSYVTVRSKCLSCGLHFVVCTWDASRHSAKTLHCPECGEHSGKFITWFKKMFGFIFQMVPGAGQVIGGATVDLKRK